jgi:hypothetical protein
MFSSWKRLVEKAGPRGEGRLTYLQELVLEFQSIQDHIEQNKVMKTHTYWQRRRELVAHLANFCYDPIHFDFIRQLNVLELFLGKNFLYMLLSPVPNEPFPSRSSFKKGPASIPTEVFETIISLDVMEESDDMIMQFASAGLSNLCDGMFGEKKGEERVEETHANSVSFIGSPLF